MEGYATRVVGAFGRVCASSLATFHAVAGDGLVQMKIGANNISGQLVQRSQIIDQPETTTLGSGNQVVVFDGQIGDRYNRQIQLERLPVGAIVEGDVHPRFSTCVQQTCTFLISADNPRKMVVRNAIGDFGPGFAVVFGVKQIRLVVS